MTLRRLPPTPRAHPPRRDSQIAGHQPRRPKRVGRIMAFMALIMATLLTAVAIGAPAAVAHTAQDRLSPSATPQTSRPQNAIAHTSTNAIGTVSSAANCPSASILLYDHKDFQQLLACAGPFTNCNEKFELPNDLKYKVESVRNWTGCQLFLMYYCDDSNKKDLCHKEWMRPYSEDGTITPLNKIVALQLATG
jgi:hypothetical protein